MRMRLAFLAWVLALGACSPSGAVEERSAGAATRAAASAHPESGLRVIPLTVSGESGTHAFRVEVAVSNEEQARGLMFRAKMEADEGMLFPMTPPRAASFWMRNTVIPLDIIFVGRDRRILNIEAEAVPYSEEPRRSEGEAIAVLELNGGRAAELGIGPGDKVEW